MTCSSIRMVGGDHCRDEIGRFAVPIDVEEVQCIRPSGHSGVYHHGMLQDLTMIYWEGFAADQLPDETKGQEALDFTD
jgi:hypothetical protein